MVFTPYPKANSRVENPTLRASHDSLTWVRVPGVPDPLVPTPDDPTMHNADPDLVHHDNSLYVIYITTNDETAETNFSVVRSDDILHWSEPCAFYRGMGGVSPACQVSRELWQLWFIRMESSHSDSKLIYRSGSDLFHLGNECTCQLKIPNHIPWHIDVRRIDSGFEALVAAFPIGTDNSRTRLFHAISRDGLFFALTRSKAILEPTTFGWDNRMIYRSTFLKDPDGTYRIWYSGGSWGRRTGIGLVQGTLDSLTEPASGFLAPVRGYITRIPEDLLGLLKYEIRHVLLMPFYSVLIKLHGGA